MKKQLMKVELFGEVVGKGWYGQTATKTFDVTLVPNNKTPFTSEWHGYRAALLDVTNDGDFQYAAILSADSRITYATAYNRTEQVSFALDGTCKALSDLWASEQEQEAADVSEWDDGYDPQHRNAQWQEEYA